MLDYVVVGSIPSVTQGFFRLNDLSNINLYKLWAFLSLLLSHFLQLATSSFFLHLDSIENYTKLRNGLYSVLSLINGTRYQ